MPVSQSLILLLGYATIAQLVCAMKKKQVQVRHCQIFQNYLL